MKNKKILLITIFVLVLLGGLGTFGFITYKNYMEEQRLKEEQEKKEKAEACRDNYACGYSDNYCNNSCG